MKKKTSWHFYQESCKMNYFMVERVSRTAVQRNARAVDDARFIRTKIQ